MWGGPTPQPLGQKLGQACTSRPRVKVSRGHFPCGRRTPTALAADRKAPARPLRAACLPGLSLPPPEHCVRDKTLGLHPSHRAAAGKSLPEIRARWSLEGATAVPGMGPAGAQGRGANPRAGDTGRGCSGKRCWDWGGLPGVAHSGF